MFGQYDESYLQHFGHCSLDVVLRLTQSVFGSTGFHGAEKSVDNCFHWLHQIHCHWHCYDQIHSLLHHQKSKTDTLSYMHKMSQYKQEYIRIGIYQTRTVFLLLHQIGVNSLSESVILTHVLSSMFPFLGTICSPSIVQSPVSSKFLPVFEKYWKNAEECKKDQKGHVLKVEGVQTRR